MHFDKYVEKSEFLAEINNEKEIKNETYAENLAKLEHFVLVKFTKVCDGKICFIQKRLVQTSWWSLPISCKLLNSLSVILVRPVA